MTVAVKGMEKAMVDELLPPASQTEASTVTRGNRDHEVMWHLGTNTTHSSSKHAK
jgi:hypothetical protein